MSLLDRVRPAAFLAIALAFAATLQTAAQTPQTKPPKFGATTDLVTTPVIVRDGRGNFVPGLTIDDFEIFEDGVRQTPTTFVSVIGNRVLTGSTPARRNTEGLILPATAPAESGRVVIVFIDDLHIQPGDTLQARRALNQVRDILLHDGDLVGLVSTGYSGVQGSMMYGYSRNRFDQAVARVMGSGMTFDEIVAANQTREGPAGLRHNAHVAFRTAYDMLEEISKITDRRKIFVYLSSGYDFNPYVDSRLKAVQDLYGTIDDAGTGKPREELNRLRNPFESNGQQFAEMDLIAEIAELGRAAQRANVSFYPIDPRGLIAGPPIGSLVQNEEFHRQMMNSVSSLQALADQTGGICACQKNDIAGVLRQIDNLTSDYYLIGYTSSNTDLLRVKRRIEVRLKRKGLEATGYKQQYWIKRRPID